MKKILLTLACLLGLAGSVATVATPLDVEEALTAARKAPRNRAAQRTAGDALYEAGRYKEAITYYLKSDNTGNLGAARAAFRMYNFDGARTYLSRYLDKRTKAERERDIAASGNDTDPTETLAAQIAMGDDMLGRVEKVTVIDSINVPAEDFFQWMRLARSAGTIASADLIEEIISPEMVGEDEYLVVPGYLTEEADRLLWAKGDADDNVTLYETVRLVDGSWGEPTELFSHASLFDADDGGDFVGHPFLMPDGVTLYFAADGDRSLGGLDIFMSRRDERGFLQPSNVGMPFNSLYDDYMLAIDEETGAGWWASDRNQIADSVTLYVFIPSEVRVNYPTDTPDLASLARISSIKLTQEDGADYRALRRRIASIKQTAPKVKRDKGPEFTLALPDGRVITRYSDFTSARAREAMKEYLEAEAAYKANLEQLAALRLKYGQGDRSVSGEILRLESECETEDSRLVEQRNQVINSEI